ncbi:MAG TPA: hypothetical protein VJ698_22640 [Noviherbaspirillum sp.]|uniref:hypothetical protein n=1 Tax=Noviherbaspirillum sp. TaxID=1926288 RepID=UPI002B47AC79|nr:hypothetical protein [Noviherbaspirillum sp.]HJV88285.1 hypothetical protein [Noviherbaspirillum sp.]
MALHFLSLLLVMMCHWWNFTVQLTGQLPPLREAANRCARQRNVRKVVPTRGLPTIYKTGKYGSRVDDRAGISCHGEIIKAIPNPWYYDSFVLTDCSMSIEMPGRPFSLHRWRSHIPADRQHRIAKQNFLI